MHHALPVAVGGSDRAPSNLMLLCQNCHLLLHHVFRLVVVPPELRTIENNYQSYRWVGPHTVATTVSWLRHALGLDQ